MIIGLIPSRLNSSRLTEKPLLEIDGLPLIVHTFKRAQLSKFLDRVIVCTDSKKILKIVNMHGGEAIMTSGKHTNGTERIAEVSKKFKCELIVDIQGDEPLIDPNNIDKLINYHKKNQNKFDIIVPSAEIKDPGTKNVVKIIANKGNKIIYMSRAAVPFNFKAKSKFYKHLSIISFKPNILQKFAKLKKSNLEKIEDIELLRAIENDINVGTLYLKSKSVAVDIKEDYLEAIEIMKKDENRKKY
jgi:3-deoxy-manno-octulosonate cytidylyltransferase (CMP-KDO synthetase)